MLFVFLGPPGAGKGTQSLRLIEHLGIPHLSTGDILRKAVQDDTELGKTAASYMESGQLVPDQLVVDVVGHRLQQPDCQQGCLLDGFPRNRNQAYALDEFLQQHGRSLDLVLDLAVDLEELQRRMLERAEIENRADDTPETISKRLQVYQEATEPLKDYYRRRQLLESIDGMGTPEVVADRIRAVVDRYKK